MKFIAAIILLSAIFLSFLKIQNQDANQLMQADRDFCKLCQDSGMFRSFLAYADDNVIKPEQGKYALMGKDALRKSYEGKDDTKFKLHWKPVRSDISASGDLGYTFGNWKYSYKTKAGSDTSEYGNYVTIWKKQKNGKWKFVLDTGNDTPEPLGGY